MDNLELAEEVLQEARRSGIMIATAESCTGGLIAGALTEVAGSSDVVECGFVTYSNAAKSRMLGVPADLIERLGAVSDPVAGAMARGALEHSVAGLSVAVTGVAGPGGGSAEKPVGLVFIATCRSGEEPLVREHRFRETHPNASRTQIRQLTVVAALRMLLEASRH